jgi:hypothetical protein
MSHTDRNIARETRYLLVRSMKTGEFVKEVMQHLLSAVPELRSMGAKRHPISSVMHFLRARGTELEAATSIFPCFCSPESDPG